jgi:ribosomal protein S2
MVQKDQNRNEWKMPLELFGYFGGESFSVLRVLFEIQIEMNLFSFLTYHLYFRKRKPEMTILSTVCTKLLCTNAHLGRRVAAHHFKVYICGSRNGIAILDSDKTLICLRNALHFIGSLIRKKGRFFFLKTNQIFFYEIIEEMVSCINDSQCKIGAFLTNSYANPKKFRSRKKKINFGLNQQPDCVVILKADRKSSVILEADRSQIPIVALVDSTIPWESYKRITYPIPANDSIQFVYLFCHLITKTAERPRITAMNVDRVRRAPTLPHFRFRSTASGMRTYSSSSSSPRSRGQRPLLYPLWLFCFIILFPLSALCWLQWYCGFYEAFFDSLSNLGSSICGLFGMIRSPQEEAVPLQHQVNNDPGFYAGSPKEELGKGKGKAPIEHSGVPPRLQSLGDLIIPSPESTPATASSSPESTPATASSSHLPGEGRPLTREEENRLEIALSYKQRISNLLRTIATDKGENFAEETNPDLAEAALDWEDCWDPKQLLNIIKSLEFHKGQSSFYKRTEEWVKAERQFRRGQ